MSIRSKIPTESKHGDKKTTVPLIEKTTTDRMKDLRQDWLLQHRKGPRTRNRQDDKGGLLKRHSFSHLTYSKARAEQFFLKLQTINVGLGFSSSPQPAHVDAGPPSDYQPVSST